MSDSPKQNVLFITADQWRGDCLSALDHPCVRTPNIDALIADSVLFRNHYSVCVPCGPARASLLTGMYVQNHRSATNGTPLDSRHSNIALEARRMGYDPVLFGYTDTALDPRDTPENILHKYGYEGVLPGFRNEVLMMESNPAPWLDDLRVKGYEIPENIQDLFAPIEGYPDADGKGLCYPPTLFSAEDSQTAFLTRKLIDHLGDRNDGWFAHISYLRPHPPFTAPEPYNSMYDADQVPMPERAGSVDEQASQHPWMDASIHQPTSWYVQWMYEALDSETYDRDMRQVRAAYYGLVSKIDTYVGKLIDHLKATGAWDNTLIVLTSDHGEMLGDRYMFGKRGYADTSYHIPLIIRDPGSGANATRGRIVEQMTESVDVMPSILDWLDLDIPRQCDGKSLIGFWTGNDPLDWRQEVHWEYDFRDVETPRLENLLGLESDECSLNVIRDGRFKYVHFAALKPLLFDLQNDPHERVNLADDPAYGAELVKYAQKMLSWRMCNDERTLSNIKVTRHGVF